jgi:hypothetical protein
MMTFLAVEGSGFTGAFGGDSDSWTCCGVEQATHNTAMASRILWQYKLHLLSPTVYDIVRWMGELPFKTCDLTNCGSIWECCIVQTPNVHMKVITAIE